MKYICLKIIYIIKIQKKIEKYKENRNGMIIQQKSNKIK